MVLLNQIHDSAWVSHGGHAGIQGFFSSPTSVVTVKLGTRANIFGNYFMFFGDFCSVDKIQCSILVACLTAFNYHFYFLFSSGTYLEKSPRLGELLNRLVSSGKMLFLITNSGYEFV